MALASNVSARNESMANILEQLSATNHTKNNSGGEQILDGDYQSTLVDNKIKAM